MHPNKSLLYCLAVVTAVLFLVISSGCTKTDEPREVKKGRIDKITDQAAETAVKKIRTPKDKARAAGDLGDERLENIDKAMQQQ